jgi:glycerophosphoryl diester phosphodiesterase
MVLRIGHKGCSYKRANSLEAIEHAIHNLKVDVVEIDIRLTKDLKLVLHHDPNFTVNNQIIEIYSHNYSDLIKYKNIDKLSDVAKHIPDECKIYLDLKKSNDHFENDYNEKIENKIVEYFKSLSNCDNYIVASFDHEIVRNILSKSIKHKIIFIKTCYITYEFPMKYIKRYLKHNDIDYLSCSIQSINKKVIEICHEYNIQVLVYTVNNKQTMDKLVKLGVDGVISDMPDRI